MICTSAGVKGLVLDAFYWQLAAIIINTFNTYSVQQQRNEREIKNENTYYIYTVFFSLTRLSREDTICEQRGVFRVNCVDCLDRTNVSQTAVARIVMETQVIDQIYIFLKKFLLSAL